MYRWLLQRGGLTNQVHNAVCHTQCARRLHTSTNVLDVRFQLRLCLSVHAVHLAVFSCLELAEIGLGKVGETRHDIPAHQLLRVCHVALLRDLNLQSAPPEFKVHDFLHTRRGRWGHGSFMLGNLVTASDAQIHAPFANKGRYVGSGEEDQCQWQVLHQCDVQAGVAVELDVGAGKEVETCLLQAALCRRD